MINIKHKIKNPETKIKLDFYHLPAHCGGGRGEEQAEEEIIKTEEGNIRNRELYIYNLLHRDIPL